MKLLFIVTRTDTFGGSLIHVRDTTYYLKKQGEEVQVITGKKGIYNQVLEQYDIPNVACKSLVQPIKPYQDGKTLAELKQLIQHYNPDLVSTHSSKAGILGRIACKLNNIPCLFTAHGWAFTKGVPQPKRSIYRTLEVMAAPLADRIICVSEQDRQIGIASGMNPKKLTTVHNGMPDISPNLKADPSQSNPVSIIMVARFDQQKDHSTLLKAIKNIPQVEVNLIGDGPRLEEIKHLSKKLEIQDRVNFLGLSSDVSHFLAKASIFVLISHWEGFPRTILEAMRAGLPVVATDVGGVKESVLDGVTGFCIPRQNVLALEEKLMLLVKNPDLRTKMGKAGRERYEKEFTFERMLKKTLSIYKEVLSEKGKQ
ncbi:glycosyltransferase family 4 protein [Euhalothece natronophila Z-M001]|uniref:Glycosyltransferase family 4 protein n=1 Tax=Euhalothece natronophila Z-M001 TaxID=522448 RepID=A0A5B8NMN5_9CHRO|nr:glycosyltransferase family 4 protein [Euhalothece natronophila]QDZ39379.1 glycosyltransferase family 4 protein [Euhalothece natronophila Z-M001]